MSAQEFTGFGVFSVPSDQLIGFYSVYGFYTSVLHVFSWDLLCVKVWSWLCVKVCQMCFGVSLGRSVFECVCVRKSVCICCDLAGGDCDGAVCAVMCVLYSLCSGTP